MSSQFVSDSYSDVLCAGSQQVGLMPEDTLQKPVSLGFTQMLRRLDYPRNC